MSTTFFPGRVCKASPRETEQAKRDQDNSKCFVHSSLLSELHYRLSIFRTTVHNGFQAVHHDHMTPVTACGQNLCARTESNSPGFALGAGKVWIPRYRCWSSTTIRAASNFSQPCWLSPASTRKGLNLFPQPAPAGVLDSSSDAADEWHGSAGANRRDGPHSAVAARQIGGTQLLGAGAGPWMVA